MDPGNFATNIQAGAQIRLHAALGRAAGQPDRDAVSGALGQARHRHRPQSRGDVPRLHFPPPVVWPMWVVSEIAAMATDLAEFLGGAIGLSLLFQHAAAGRHGRSPPSSPTRILMFQDRGFRPTRAGHRRARRPSSALCYLVEMFIAPVDWGAAALHTVVPQHRRMPTALMLAVGIIGATVMPHAVYLHSGLTQARMPARDDERAAHAGALLQPGGGHRARRRRAGQHGHGDDGVGRLPCRPSATWPRSRPPITR